MTKRILFIVAALALAGSGWYVRSLNVKAAEDRVQVIISKDKAGADVTTDEAELKSFAGIHMGASAKYTLDGAYARAQAAAQASASAQAATAQIYADAQKACSGKNNSVTQAKCNQDYLSKHLKTPVAEVPAPDKASFVHAVKAPMWTPDLAGALLLGSLLSVGLAVYYTIRRQV